MKHVTVALLVIFALFAACNARAPQKEQPAKVDTAAAAPHAITPVNSWAHFRALKKAEGRSDAEVDEMVQTGLASMKTMDRAAGNDRIGVAAPPFQFDAWFNTEPLTLDGLRGRVLLVRWWTETCPFCASSSPALRTLHDEYADKGLTVIGVFHPKAGRDDPIDLERVRRAVETRGFKFPVAVDWDWRHHTLRQWWLTGPERPATSVTFLVDKTGVIRFVHPGMEYHDPDGNEGHEMCNADMANIRAAIGRLLAE